MEYQRSPLRIVVAQGANKGHVMVVPTAAYVYRRSGDAKKTATNYWRPTGEYFVRYGPFRYPVTFDGNGFLLTISVPDFLELLAIFKRKLHHGSTYQPKTGEGVFDGEEPAANSAQ